MKKAYFFLIAFSITLGAFSQNWGLDQDFNSVGYNATNIILNGDDNAECLAIQNDGKILAAGYGLSIVRYNSNGTLDTSFNGVGYTAPFGNNTTINQINQILIKPDGKILVIGSIYTNKYYLFLTQYNSNGTLDTAFGTSGRKNIDIGSAVTFSVGNAIYTSDDKILICSNSFVSQGDFTLIRCSSLGNLDTTFGATGIITVDGLNNDALGRIALKSDGKILLSGNANSNPTTGTYKQHVLMLLNQDGTPDISFGNNGKVFTNFNINNTQTIQSTTVLNDGKIIIGGSIMESLSNQTDFFLSKLNSNGTVDTTFGVNGKSIVDFNEFYTSQTSNDFINRIAIQNDGKIIATGFTNAFNIENRFSLARLTADGILDATFGTNGKLVLPIYGFSDAIMDVKTQSDGKVVVCGSTKINSIDRAYIVARFTPNSTLSTQNEVALNNQIQLYPNPVKGKMIINGLAIQNGDEKSYLTIYSMDGKELKTMKAIDYLYNNQLEIDLTDFVSGMYMLKVSDGTNEFVKKIIKE